MHRLRKWSWASVRASVAIVAVPNACSVNIGGTDWDLSGLEYVSRHATQSSFVLCLRVVAVLLM
jgi:hypothetical protein